MSAIAPSPVWLDDIAKNHGEYTDELQNRTLWTLPYDQYVQAGPLPLVGQLTSNVPVSQAPQAHTGAVHYGFVQDWYNHIHVIPANLNLGNLVSSQTREVEVWNAYFEPKALGAITPAGDDGLTFEDTDPPPKTYGALESQAYTVSISLTGPPTIAATYIFDFPDYDPVLSITGARVVPWSIPPDWSGQVIEVLAWQTDILAARAGTEQRRKLRKHPRRELEFDVLRDRDYRLLLDHMLWGWQARVYALPIWMDAQRLASELPMGSTSIPISTTGRDFTAGRLVALYRDPKTIEVLEVDSVSAGAVALVRPNEVAWPAGSRVIPVRLARVSNAQPVTYLTDRAGALRMSWRIQENDGATATDGATTYRGYSVLTESPNWTAPLEVEVSRDIVEWDAPTWRDGLWEDRAGAAFQTIEAEWLLRDRASISDWRAWLHARAGKYKPVWVPSWREDLVLAQAIGAGNTVVDVRNDGYTRYASGTIGRRDIRIRHRDGRIWYRRISGAAEVDSSTERLTIDSSLGAEVDPDDVTISYLALCRLASDRVELAWVTDALATIRLTLRGVLDDV